MRHKNPTKPYPRAQATRTGCKVSWYYFDDRKDAEKCAEAAKHNARYYASQGYDFGYCAPGFIEWAKPGNWPEAGDNGRWEVCIP